MPFLQGSPWTFVPTPFYPVLKEILARWETQEMKDESGKLDHQDMWESQETAERKEMPGEPENPVPQEREVKQGSEGSLELQGRWAKQVRRVTAGDTGKWSDRWTSTSTN